MFVVYALPLLYFTYRPINRTDPSRCSEAAKCTGDEFQKFKAPDSAITKRNWFRCGCSRRELWHMKELGRCSRDALNRRWYGKIVRYKATVAMYPIRNSASGCDEI